MKFSLLMLFISFQVLANPLDQMNQRLKVYSEDVQVTCANGANLKSDAGLFIDVSCNFQCKSGGLKIERVRGTFIPKQLGLIPGNGSSDENIMWGAGYITMKNWSQNICLQKAAEGCKSLDAVEVADVAELESGEWKLNRFPGCAEKSITFSPFDEKINSNRVQPMGNLDDLYPANVTKSQYEIQLGKTKVSIPYSSFDPEKDKCQKFIKAKICFGDCVDLSTDSGYMETFATNEPLGNDELVLCGDDFYKSMESLKTSKAVKQKLCEDYLWSNLGHKGNLFRSCSAIRGEVACENL